MIKVIDFHTHIYPDAISEKTIAALTARSGVQAAIGGKRADLIEAMAEAKVSASVVLPVATRPEQVQKINRKNAALNGQDGLIFFGAMHPDLENPEEELDWLAAAGFRGIKLHPDYQDTFFQDEKYVRILAGAARRGLLTVTHAGADPGYRGQPVRCTPDQVLFMLNRLKGVIENRLILAHLGGTDMPEEVLDKLAGQPVYMDTAFVLDRYPDMCRAIIRKHGADRVLFATDSPWRGQVEYIQRLKGLGLTAEEEADILYKNGERLLGLEHKD